MYKLCWILKTAKVYFFLKRVTISANQMINGDSKGVNNRHVQFGSITSLGKAVMDTTLLWLSHRKCMAEVLIGHKYCQTFE